MAVTQVVQDARLGRLVVVECGVDGREGKWKELYLGQRIVYCQERRTKACLRHTVQYVLYIYI